MITNKLSKASLKQTIQREEILRYILNEKNHPTADMIYNHIIKLIPHVSRTTVYNNLKSLENAKIIRAFDITGEDETRYDGNMIPHHHFVCEECGQIYDIDSPQCECFKKENVDGHIIKKMYMYFKGICKKCANTVK